MDKIIVLIKNLNDTSESAEIFHTRPEFTYGFSLDTDGRHSRLSVGPLGIVDGHEFPLATAPELIGAALEGIKRHIEALRHANKVLIFLNQTIARSQTAQAAEKEMER